MTHRNFFAHAEPASVDLTGLAFVAIMAAAASYWLIRINRRLDAQEDPMTDTDTTATEPRSSIGYIILAALVVLLAGMGVAVYRAQSDLETTTATQSQTVVDDLCLAAEQAETDTDAALATFNTSPHNALHNLDTELRRTDPLAAQRLAAAKAAAEEALISRAADASARTTELAEQTADAYRSLEPGTQISGCA